MDIKIINSDCSREDFIQLLLLADPYLPMLEKYINKGDFFILYFNSEVIGVSIVIPYNNSGYEIKNIAIKQEFQNKRFGITLIEYIVNYYRDKSSKIMVGTSESGVEFYKKCGFIYSHTIKNFFIDNYPLDFFQDEVCIDMIYLSHKY